MELLKRMGKKLLLGLKITGKFLLLCPILLAFMGFNYVVDTAGIFRSSQFEREIAQALLAGNAVSNYDQMDEQEILKQLTAEMQEPFDTIALGSSRILQMTAEVAGDESFMNCGVSGSDYIDVMSSFYLFDKAGMLPKNLIIGIDPWIFSPNEDAVNWRSDKELYNEFLSVALGIETDYEPPSLYEQYEPLVDPAYFQANVRHLFDPDKEQDSPTVVEGDVNSQNTNIKLSDGTVMYAGKYRAADAPGAELRARDTVNAFSSLKYYDALDPQRTELFDRFIHYVQDKGVNVIFALTPFHPITYYHATENPQIYAGFLSTEPWVSDYALANDIPVYGSFNPFVTNNQPEDFYDGLHIKSQAMERYFPGVEEITKLQSAGKKAVSPWFDGRVRIEYPVAEQATALRYEIEKPEILKRMADEEINGAECYVLGRYESKEKGAVLLARYAVTQDEGIIFRFDTDLDLWMVDSRFIEQPASPE